MAHVTFVKKILEDGELCKKCQDVSERLTSDGLLQTIDQIVIADVRDDESEGMKLAKRYQVSRAPFFIVENELGEVDVYDVYFQFKRYITSQTA